MAQSVELRVPFVDAILQRSGRPMAQRGAGKAEIARRLAPELPATLFGRRKTGFLTPFASWLEGSPRQQIGRGSRDLARRVLLEWNVDLEPSRPVSRRGSGVAAPETLVLLPGLYGEHGGIQTYGRNLVEAMRQLGARPHVVVLNDQTADLEPLRSAGIPARGFERRRVAFALAAARQARRGAREVWLGHRNFIRLAPVLRRSGVPLTLILYGIDAWPRLTWTERHAMASIDRVLAISPYTADCFRRAGYHGPIGLLPCSLPFGWTPPQQHRQPAFRPPFRILSVSRLAQPERYKGLDDTILAVAHLRRNGLDVEYHIAGDGPDAARLRGIANDAGVAGSVMFHGRVSEAALRELYAGCDLFVLPSGAEGFGIVYLEAMVFERGVIAAAAGGVPFLVRDGATGWLVPHGDREALVRCIRERLVDPLSTAQAALRARQLVEKDFSFPVFVRNVASMLDGSDAVARASA